MRFLPQGVIAYLEVGLPNITGGFSHRVANGFTIPRALYGEWGVFSEEMNDHYGNVVLVGGGFSYQTTITFNASRSSQIYGNSTTVQPSAMTVNYFIRAK